MLHSHLKQFRVLGFGAVLMASSAFGQFFPYVADYKWTTFVQWFPQEVQDRVVVMAGDPPPQFVFSSADDRGAFNREQMLSRIERLIGYEAITQRVEGQAISVAFRPSTLPFHLQLRLRDPRELDIARDTHGARPWPPDMLVRREVPGYTGLTVDLRTPHAGTLGDLAALNFSKRVDVAPVLRNAIVVAKGVYREEWLLQAVAAAVGGVFRETSDTFVIDPEPRAWRSMMVNVLDRRIAMAASPAQEESLTISREALLMFSDSDLRRSLSARHPDPARLVGQVERPFEWASPLGRRVARFLEFMVSEAYPEHRRETNRQALALIDLDRPVRLMFSGEGAMIVFHMKGTEAGAIPMFGSG